MRDVAVVVLILIGVLWTLRRPWFGVLLWTWVSVMNPHRFCWGFAFDAPMAAVAAGAALVGLLIAHKRQNPFMGAPTTWMLLFACWMSVSWWFGYGMRSSDPIMWDIDYELWKQVIKTFLMIFVTLALLRYRQQILAFVAVAVMSLGLLGVKGGIFTLATLGGNTVWGPPGTFIEDNNDFGLALVTIVPLLVFLLMQTDRARKWLRLGIWLTIALSVLAIFGSQSRGGFLALAAMGVVLWWRSRYKLKLALFFVVLAGIATSLMPDKYWEKIDTIAAYETDDSFQNRVRSWKVAVQVANHHVTGAGMIYRHPSIFYLWDFSESKDRGKPIAPHSIYFQILGNHGYVGLFLYLMIGVSTWLSASWLRRRARAIPEAKWAADLGSMVQVAMVGFAVGGAALSLAYVDIPFNMMVMVALARHWVETKGWKRDPEEGFFKYVLRGGEPKIHRPPAVAGQGA
ncbi:MAG: putative O-glycosylation ligase, exosortase A system-associated [Azoarcus sp.]|nr:putative O-glycosylation ligase, exosortase A system-associated [Azoarcus sp.]